MSVRFLKALLRLAGLGFLKIQFDELSASGTQHPTEPARGAQLRGRKQVPSVS